jgi:hypothetical protein
VHATYNSSTGFEYHMSARAVKFIRDQALTADSNTNEKTVKPRQRAGSVAAQAVRRMLVGEDKQRPNLEKNTKSQSPVADIDPLYGWDQGVTARKAHLCLLLKPQIVLHNTNTPDSKLVLIANHVISRNYGILDTLNASDPVSGFIMQRYSTLCSPLSRAKRISGILLPSIACRSFNHLLAGV